MNRNNDYRTAFAICFIFLSFTQLACVSPHYYRSKPLEPLLLSRRGAAKINLISDGDNYTAVSAAYSPAEHFGVTGGAAFLNNNDVKTGESNFNPYLAAGYYHKTSPHTLIEAYGGVGLINFKSRDEVPVKKINFSDFFVQPTFAFISKNIEVAFTLRTDYLNRYQIVLNSPADITDNNFAFLKYTDYVFVQPGCTVRFGFQYLKFQIQVTRSTPLNNDYASIYGTIYNSGTDRYVFDHPLKWNSGFTLDLDILKRKNGGKN